MTAMSKPSSPKILEPLEKTEKKMQPLSEAAFDAVLKRAAQTHVPKPDGKRH
jgi:hypothetical protein